MALSPCVSLRLQDLSPAGARFCLRVERFCRDEAGLSLAGSSVLAALSGGADSLATLLALFCLAPRLGCSLVVVHLDHGLRSESSQEAEQARATAAALGLPCLVGRADVRGMARERSMGLEEAGREARSQFFADALRRSGSAWVALGHQLNDLAEDALMRLSRGAGWPALAGMAAVDPERRLFRPLLLTPRAAIDAFVAEFDVRPVTDAMNSDLAFMRNRVRQLLLPQLERENPAYLDGVAARWRLARQDELLFQTLLSGAEAEEDDAGLFLSGARLRALPKALRLRWYKRLLDGLGAGQCRAEQLLALDAGWSSGRGGKAFLFPGGKRAALCKGGIKLLRRRES